MSKWRGVTKLPTNAVMVFVICAMIEFSSSPTSTYSVFNRAFKLVVLGVDATDPLTEFKGCRLPPSSEGARTELYDEGVDALVGVSIAQ